MIAISPVSLERTGTRWTLAARVDGEEIVFASSTALAPVADGLVCAFWLPAMKAGMEISAMNSIDETLKQNLGKVTVTAQSWWGLHPTELDAQTTMRTPGSSKGGVFFTCGVDSFYTLRSNHKKIDALINVLGFDIKLADTERVSRMNKSLERASADVGKPLIQVSSNLRESARFQTLNWELTHIAALASVGHMLSDHVSRIFIGSSQSPPPWGSHPDLDKLWSSGAMLFVNDEFGITRLEKVRAIHDWDPVLRNLKVCWENRTEELNCGICEKCVRTQAEFAVFDASQKVQTFPRADIAALIDDLPALRPHHRRIWTDVANNVSDRRIKAAVSRLLRKSYTYLRFKRRLRREATHLARRVGVLPA